MSLNWKQFELGVLRPTMARLQYHCGIDCSENVVMLVGETIWHESDALGALGQYSREAGRVFGPGLGIASFERPTWDWLYPLYRSLAVQLGHGDRQVHYDELAWNLALNVIACRLRYYVDRRKLPDPAGGIAARADYWFDVYNASGVPGRKAKYVRDAVAIPWIVEKRS